MALEHRVLEDIRTFFNNEFAVNLSDLQKLTYVFVRDFYARALMEFEIDTDNVRKASHLIEGMDSDTVEITGDINLVAAINKTFGFLNFGLFDLLSPSDNSKRTLSMISAVMEFLNMADEVTAGLDFESYRDFRKGLLQQAEEVDHLKQKMTHTALEKDQLVQGKLRLEEELAELKDKELHVCMELSEAEKEASAAASQLEEKEGVLKSVKDETEKYKIAIKTLKEELSYAQSLESKEEESKKVEEEKAELYKKYKDKVEARTKLSSHLGAIKDFTAATDSVAELFDEINAREQAIALLQKETLDLEQVVANEKKEQSNLDREALAAEQITKQVEKEMITLKEQFTKKSEDHTECTSKLKESLNKMEEDAALKDSELQNVNEELLNDQEIFKKFVISLSQIIKKRIQD